MRQLLLVSTLFLFQTTFGQVTNLDYLNYEISKILKGKKATVGIAIRLIEKNIYFGFNDEIHFPMQSVFKFPQALYAFNLVDSGVLDLNQEVLISEEIASKFSNSSLKNKYTAPSFTCTLGELIRFSVSNSDNLSCDVLFELFGGTKVVDEQVKKWGYKDFNIAFNEIGMSKKIKHQFKNYSSPKTMVDILTDFKKGKLISPKSTELLMKFMIESPTSSKRIKGLLPENTVVAHKTGTGDGENFIYALNDVGLITLPDGNHLALAVFIKNSAENYETTERMIAEITQLVFNHFLTKRN